MKCDDCIYEKSCYLLHVIKNPFNKELVSELKAILQIYFADVDTVGYIPDFCKRFEMRGVK